VICPDSKLAALDEWAANKRAEWGVDELPGTELTDDQVWDVCRFMREQALSGLVQATDTNAVTRKDIEHHRLKQAVRLHENMNAWKHAGGQGTSIPAWYERLVKVNAYTGRVSPRHPVRTTRTRAKAGIEPPRDSQPATQSQRSAVVVTVTVVAEPVPLPTMLPFGSVESVFDRR
jgi:hypothetical protein